MSFYHFFIEYKSGAVFEFAYEVNLTENQALNILARIEAKAPEITFDGQKIYPKRIRVLRIYKSEVRYPFESKDIHEKYHKGYTGNFDGEEVTRLFLSKSELTEAIKKIKEPEIKEEIGDALSRLKRVDNEDDLGPIVVEIVSRFGSRVVDDIIKEIQNDSITPSDEYGVFSTINSRKWNAIALTYFKNNFIDESIKIFEELNKKESNNPATQNNFGVVLLNKPDGQYLVSRAKELFKKAYESDKKRGNEEAKKLPAYINLINLERGKPELGETPIMGNPTYHYILFMDIVGFSRPTWYGTIQVEKINYLTSITRTYLTDLGLNYQQIPMLPTGDGMVLFFEDISHPIEFSIKISEHLHRYNETQDSDKKLELRIGVYAGESFPVKDLHGHGNRCGPAINSARRVMDFGESWHILCSSEYGHSLTRLFGEKYGKFLHDCGPYEAKHGEIINLNNIFGDSFGNPNCPKKKATT